jgi:biopolymer transport protein TolR
MQVRNANNRSTRRRNSAMSDINITPMVDVMLVLLIIFMVAAPMMSTGINIELPKASTNQIKLDSKPISVSLNQQNELFVNNDRVMLENLGSQIDRLATDKSSQILLRSDSGVSYGDAMRVMAAISRAGYANIGLLTQKQ